MEDNSNLVRLSLKFIWNSSYILYRNNPYPLSSDADWILLIYICVLACVSDRQTDRQTYRSYKTNRNICYLSLKLFLTHLKGFFIILKNSWYNTKEATKKLSGTMTCPFVKGKLFIGIKMSWTDHFMIS